MRGPRARVRDAILVAELSTLIGRLAAPGDTRCTLFYRYFDEDLGLVTRVASTSAARDAIRDVVANERSGGTDIQKALLASLAQVAEARAEDVDLARAQIVLVTDGEAAVDEDRIVAARDALAGLPIGISVIALGKENPALRGLVARQRAKGEAAFYHHLDDAELEALLEEECGGLLDELESLDRARDLSALEDLEVEAQARREVGLDADGAEGSCARSEALRRDRVAIGARFARWFPEAIDDATAPVPAADREEIEATAAALASVAEVVSLLGGAALARQADAIELLERLLPDAGLTPTRYRSLVRQYPAALAPPLRALRDAALGQGS